MKGQMTIYGIMMVFVAVLIVGMLAPLFNVGIEMIQNATATTNPVASTMAGMIFPMLVLAIILGILGYASFGHVDQQGY